MEESSSYLYFKKFNTNLFASHEFQKQNFTPKGKHDINSQKLADNNFEKKVQKMFERKKFVLDNSFDYEGSENFLKDKDECMKNMNLSDEIEEENPSKRFKRKQKFKRIMKSSDDRRTSKIIQRRKKRESFFSFGSSGCVDEVLNLLY